MLATLFDHDHPLWQDRPTTAGALSAAREAGPAWGSGRADCFAVGHEIGHVLGLVHLNDNDRFMTGNETTNTRNPPLDLISTEVSTLTFES